MTIYKVTGFNGKQTAQVEARTEYDAKRYVLETLPENYAHIDDMKAQKMWSHIKFGPAKS